MKRIYICLLVAAFALQASQAHAQKNDKKLSFGFGIEGGVVTGDVKEVYNVAAGVTARGAYKLGPGFITLTSGGIVLLPKSFEGEDLKAGLVIPVKAGYKFIFKEHYFAMGEVGVSSIRTYSDDSYGGVTSYSEGGFTFAPAIGAQFGTFEISARYESTALNYVNLSAAMLRVGFNF